jgi:hypothetical protein
LREAYLSADAECDIDGMMAPGRRREVGLLGRQLDVQVAYGAAALVTSGGGRDSRKEGQKSEQLGEHFDRFKECRVSRRVSVVVGARETTSELRRRPREADPAAARLVEAFPRRLSMPDSRERRCMYL